MPVHRATVERFGRMQDRDTAWTRPGNLVSNGAFVLTEWRPNARIIVAKNPRYWDAAHNHLERVIFFPVENADSEENNFRAGQLHLTYGLPTAKIASYQREAPDRLRLDPMLALNYLNFNTTRPPFDNPKVRRALALAIDRDTIARKVTNGARLPASTLVPPNCGGYVSPAGQPFDFAAARALLAEAGFPGGRGLPSLPLQVPNGRASAQIAEAMQGMWLRELGLHVTIETYEQRTGLQNQQTLNFTFGFQGWVADFADPITFLDIFRTGGGNNWTGWSSKVYDGLLDRAANTPDPAARFALLRQAESLLLEEAPVAPFIFSLQTYLIHPAVKNWEPSPLGIHRYQLVELRN
jgi:oligopeptide transport system substrate-binding protein